MLTLTDNFPYFDFIHFLFISICQTLLCLFPPSEFYDSGALMLEEEGAVMGGLLVGLNVIDANLCIKGEDLDSQVSADRVFHFLCEKELDQGKQ